MIYFSCLIQAEFDTVESSDDLIPVSTSGQELYTDPRIGVQLGVALNNLGDL
jgi:hypothetical protein